MLSRVGTVPFVGTTATFEHLLSELLVASIFYCVHFESMREHVHQMVFGVQVADWEKCCPNNYCHHQHNLCVWHFVL